MVGVNLLLRLHYLWGRSLDELYSFFIRHFLFNMNSLKSILLYVHVISVISFLFSIGYLICS